MIFSFFYSCSFSQFHWVCTFVHKILTNQCTYVCLACTQHQTSKTICYCVWEDKVFSGSCKHHMEPSKSTCSFHVKHEILNWNLFSFKTTPTRGVKRRLISSLRGYYYVNVVCHHNQLVLIFIYSRVFWFDIEIRSRIYWSYVLVFFFFCYLSGMQWKSKEFVFIVPVL